MSDRRGSEDDERKAASAHPDGAELETTLSLDELFDVLADERRRRLLFYLHGKDGETASVVELTDYLVVREADSVDDLDTDEVAITLYHTHLPKLADVGLVEYDLRSRTVRFRSDDAVAACLEETVAGRWE